MQTNSELKSSMKSVIRSVPTPVVLTTTGHRTAGEIRVTLALTIERLRQAMENVDAVKDPNELDLFYESAREFATISNDILDGIRASR